MWHNWKNTVGVWSLILGYLCLVWCSTGRSQEAASPAKIDVFTTRADYKNLVPPPAQDSFQFAVYGDRTSGVPARLKVLEQAVVDTNIIGPDLVMTVGDLVQGYNRTEPWLKEKEEFRSIMDRLKCSWFPVAGNHDVYWDQKDKDAPAGQHEANYEEHFGPLWYSFEYKKSGFLVLYTDEGDPVTNKKGFKSGFLQTMSKTQLDFLRAALKQLSECEHIFVFLHHPRWTGGGYEGGNWNAVHQTLRNAGNVSAVFAGHIHHMRYDGKRDGIEYYALATTGGNLSADFPDAGYLHHFNLVTVRPEGIHVATLPVGSVVDPKKFTQDYLAEVQKVQQMRPKLVSKRLPLSLDGSVLGQYEIELSNPTEGGDLETEMFVELPGRWQVFPSHIHLLVPAGGSASAKFKFLHDAKSPLFDNETLGPEFASPTIIVKSNLSLENARVQLPVVDHEVQLTLAETANFGQGNLCLELPDMKSSAAQGIPVASEVFALPQGPFTLEAWVNPSNNSGSRGIVAKTQSSEFALFSHEGKASFDVHLNGKYSNARAKSQLPLGQWTHVAGVFDGAELRLYLNGELVAATAAVGTRKVNQLPLYIGADPDGRGRAVRSFAGRIDEVRLSTGAVYDSEFQPELTLKKSDETVLLFHLDGQVGPYMHESGQDQLCRPVGDALLVERN